MAYQGINTGTTPNDGTGDTLIGGGVKINSNFSSYIILLVMVPPGGWCCNRHLAGDNVDQYINW